MVRGGRRVAPDLLPEPHPRRLPRGPEAAEPGLPDPPDSRLLQVPGVRETTFVSQPQNV